MKIVLDIDDEQVLFDIKNQGLEAKSETDKVIINALYNGTPLPKEHGDLIDRNELIQRFGVDDATKYGNETAEQQTHSYSTMMMYEIADVIDDASTIIEGSESE